MTGAAQAPPPLTLLSLLVNLSAPESIVSSDASDGGALVEEVAPPTSMLPALEHFLTSTDTMDDLLVGDLGTATQNASWPGLDHSSSNVPAPQSYTSSWGLTQFTNHSERIDDIRMGVHERAAAELYQSTLLAQMDGILAVFQPNDPSI
jgi:hypothetical protein